MNYKGLIIEMVEKIKEERKLRLIYMFIKNLMN